MPVGGVWPGGTPVIEPGQQGAAGELAQGLLVAGEGDAPAGQVDVVQGEFADGLGAGSVHGCQRDSQALAGVTAACPAARISSAVIGSTVRPATRPPLRCRVGSANVRPRRLANRNSERSAVMAL